MPIPQFNINTQTILAEFGITDLHDITFSRLYNEDINPWAAHKFFNRTKNSYQLPDTSHGLYRDGNHNIGYNKGTGYNISMSDLINYNHSAYPPSFFDIGAIYDSMGRNIYDPEGFNLYYNQRYNVNGYLYRGEIDPSTICTSTNWTTPTTNNKWGGVAFGKLPNTKIDASLVYSNTEYDPGQYVEFSIKHSTPPDDFLNIWYCKRDSSGNYYTTDYLIEGDYWNNIGYITYFPWYFNFETPETYYQSGAYYGKYSMVMTNSDQNTPIEDLLCIQGDITIDGNVWQPSSVSVERCNADGTVIYSAFMVNWDNNNHYWYTTQSIYEGNYYKITFYFANNELYDSTTQIEGINLSVGALNWWGGVTYFFENYDDWQYFEY